MKKLYPKTRAACQIRENAQWAIGDALIEECGRPGKTHARTGAYEKITEAAQAVLDDGLDNYPLESLRLYWRMADVFPDGSRIPSVSFGCHHEAGSPERLQQVLAVVKLPPGEKLLRRRLRQVLDDFIADEQAARAAKNAELTKQIEAGETKKTQIIGALKATTDDNSKKALRKDLDKTEKAINKARTERTIIQGMPEPNRDTTVINPGKSVTIPYLDIVTTIGLASTSLHRAQKMIEDYADRLDELSIGSLIEECTKVIDETNKTICLLRGEADQPSTTRPHLSVVGE